MSTQEGVLPHHPSSTSSLKKTYILARGLPYSVQQLGLATGLRVPKTSDRIFTDIDAELQRALKHALRLVDVQVVDMNDLGYEVLHRANNLRATHHYNIVSTCPEIAHLTGAVATLNVNRLVTFTGSEVGIGQRPGYPAMHLQVNTLVTQADGNPYVIVEDGLFSGNTMRQVIRAFEKAGAHVIMVVAGFQFPRAQQAITELTTDPSVKREIEVATVYDLVPEQLVDWMPDHDFFPFVPNCGRVLGVNMGEHAIPYYNRNGTSYSIPYLSTYCDMERWTSLPARAGTEFTRTCLGLTTQLFQEIERLNPGTSLKVGQLVECQQSNPRICMPISAGDAQDIVGHTREEVVRGQEHPLIPTPPHRSNMRVLEFLEMMRNRLPEHG